MSLKFVVRDDGLKNSGNMNSRQVLIGGLLGIAGCSDKDLREDDPRVEQLRAL